MLSSNYMVSFRHHFPFHYYLEMTMKKKDENFEYQFPPENLVTLGYVASAPNLPTQSLQMYIQASMHSDILCKPI